jgi:hypothetical protein
MLVKISGDRVININNITYISTKKDPFRYCVYFYDDCVSISKEDLENIMNAQKE